MWIEMGIFVLVILFALHQIRDVKREQRKRLDEETYRVLGYLYAELHIRADLS